MQRSFNSFLKFMLGFTVFIAVSLGLAYGVSMYSIKKERQEQTAAAFRAMLGEKESAAWWEFWK
ncbi:hypothetical protein A3A38_04475 [Candidatus Kaiserbacteria bacterium RIFCSPLOWO2_01_FULL_53_17]|uniref:Uncharacterized protein n=1 Tax=Candidatus Kaiserbacteria bacterium RIFCSPLOWO2_01_FULL_53_17 TaxID=1798511 RepID=A0A1F6EFY7_9BACT|nr:MAG: hypothetical protein A3A38_04475 [Candidatus Kaiserbacteria bacterium RIFCSPLOWO2_01_FULL_53_17]